MSVGGAVVCVGGGRVFVGGASVSVGGAIGGVFVAVGGKPDVALGVGVASNGEVGVGVSPVLVGVSVGGEHFKIALRVFSSNVASAPIESASSYCFWASHQLSLVIS